MKFSDEFDNFLDFLENQHQMNNNQTFQIKEVDFWWVCVDKDQKKFSTERVELNNNFDSMNRILNGFLKTTEKCKEKLVID